MKNLTAFCLGVSLLIFGGLACSNPLAKFTKQYNCTIAGEPEPQTSDDFLTRAFKHLELSGYTNSFDQCAFDAAAEAVRLDPKNGDAIGLRGSLSLTRANEALAKQDEKLARNSLEAALADLDEAIRLKPDRFQYYYTRSVIYEKSWFLGDTRRSALADLSKAAELCQADCHASLHQKRGDLNLELGNYADAVEDYTQALKRDPSERDYYVKRAEAYRKLGKNDLADKDDATFPTTSATDDSEVTSSVDNAPPTSTRLPVPKVVSGGVVNGKATNLVKPPYPPAARAVRASGAVNVQVTIDEKGDVISANAVSGHPLLRAAAVQAARESKFTPTLLSGKPVRVTGVVIYNFIP
jgi:TonB family protein